MTIQQRVENLQKLMKEEGIDIYIIPSEDFHQSEYVGDYFKAREFISGFTGSAGAVVVTEEEACLWTDGRYFLQGAQQLQGTGIKLQKMGEPGVPTIPQYVEENLQEGDTLGFDGRVISVAVGRDYENIIQRKKGKIQYELDLIDKVWEDRPELPKEKAFFLTEEYSGESAESKVARIRKEMEEKGADTHIMAALDDNCWMLNIRGNDVQYSPLILSYSVLTMDELYLFADESKFDEEIKKELDKVGTIIKPYNDVYEFVKKLPKDRKVLIDTNKMNYALYKNIPSEITLIEARNPAVLFKAIKNDTEVKNFINAHIKDGTAWVKFMYWLKHNIGKEEITEIGASDKLEDFRKEQDGYLWPSFAPISGYGEHAAIVHYSSTEETNIPLEPRGLYLSDTGGNYYEGSTDITRTVALGDLTEEEKYHFTLVLKSHIGLADAKFLQGASGFALDVLARKPFWDRNLDYKHGTGHGVGYLLNIHEGPSGFRYTYRPGESHPFEEGMIITVEPGIYIEGSHGVRTENLVIVRKGEKNEYGQFMYLEPCTFVPIDLDAIDPSLLDETEKNYLNQYHELVFNTISPFVNDDEREWLKKYTRKI